MTIKNFYIEMDNPVRSFFSGQPVSGKVIVESQKERRTEGIKIVFVGKATVLWTERRQVTTGTGKQRRRHTQVVRYSAEEEYFDCKINLIGNGGYEVIIPPGRHSYPFQFTLPPGLPSTFKGNHGEVSYHVTAIMKRSWRFDRVVVVPFTVNAILDLNRDTRGQLPVEVRKHKEICCLCCQSGPVGFVLKLPKSAYVPGENIKITSELGNGSSRRVLKSKLTLFQEISYHAPGKTKIQTRLVSAAKGPSIERGESEIWAGKLIQIPPVPPSKLGNCGVIDVQYYLLMEMDISGPSTNLKGKIPLIIGTIPMRDAFEELGFHQNDSPTQGTLRDSPGPSQGTPPPYTTIPMYRGRSPVPTAPAFEAYPDLPPPTYAEAVAFEKFVEPSEENSGLENPGFSGENPSALVHDYSDYVPTYITYGWTSPGPSSKSLQPNEPTLATKS